MLNLEIIADSHYNVSRCLATLLEGHSIKVLS